MFNLKVFKLILAAAFTLSTFTLLEAQDTSSAAVSKEVFIAKMQAHIERVELVGRQVFKELKTRYPKEYGDLDCKTVIGFLQLHDKTKLDQSFEFLKKHNLLDKPKIADSLAEFYGQAREVLEKQPTRFLPQGTRYDDLKYIVSLVNKSDEEIALEFMAKFDKEKREKLKLIEIASDKLDTTYSRKDEFSHKIVPASEFLAKEQALGHLSELGDQQNRLLEITKYFESVDQEGKLRYDSAIIKNISGEQYCLDKNN